MNRQYDPNSAEGDQGNYYPNGWMPDSLELQRGRLTRSFPGLKLPDPVFDRPLPSGFDAAAYHVFPERLGMHYDIPDGNRTGYGRIIEEIVFPAISRARDHGFQHRCYRQMGPDRIRLETQGLMILEAIQESTTYDAFIAPVSYGHRWYPQTKSTSMTRGSMAPANELALGTIQVGCHLLAQPGRLVDYGQLNIDCAGDEYDLYAASEWLHAPYYGFVDILEFDIRSIDNTNGRYASFVSSTR